MDEREIVDTEVVVQAVNETKAKERKTFEPRNTKMEIEHQHEEVTNLAETGIMGFDLKRSI